MVKVPDSLLPEFAPDEMASQMMVWLSLTAQVYKFSVGSFINNKKISFQLIRDLTGSSTREIVTLAALHVWAHLYDLILPKTHEWWKNGGSEFYFRLVNNAQYY